jgi:hypothetical protein
VSQAGQDRRTEPAARVPRAALDAALLLLLLAAVLALWWRFNAPPGRTGDPFPTDFLYYFVPMTELAAARLRAGELPLWNPEVCSGTPLLATLQVAALYPPTWLALAMPAATALAASLLLHVLCGTLAAALWLRALGVCAEAAAGGALLFAFACLIGNAFWPPALATIAWMPAILGCTDAWCARGRWRAWIGLVACAALQILAGFTQYVVYTAYVAAPWAAVRLASAARGGAGAREATRRGALLALAAALGVALAAVQVLPTAELARETHRGAALSAAQMHHAFRILPLSLGGALANALDPSPKLIAPGYGFGAGYLGVATLLLLVPGLATGPRALVTLLVALAACSFALSGGALGPTAPLFELFARLPTGSAFRDPQRLRLVTFLCIIPLAAFGIDAAWRGLAGFGARQRRALAAAVAAAALAIAWGGAPGAAARALAAGALLATALLAAARPAVRRGATALLLALLAFDLHHATKPASGSFRSVPVAWAQSLHAGGYTLLDAQGYARLRDEVGLARIAFPDLDPTLGVAPLSGGYRVACLDPLAPAAWTRLHAALTGDPDARHLLHKLPAEALAPFFDLAGVAIVGRLERGASPPGRRPAADGREALEAPGPAPHAPPRLRLRIERNLDALPRTYVVEDHRVVTHAEALEHAVRGGFDFRRAVLLEVPAPAPAPPDPAPLRPARIAAYAPERVEIEAEAPRGGLLVLSDSWFPGWQARVDGAEAAILRANGVYRAVALPPGRHRVVFEYRPASLRRGAALSLAAAALALAIPWAAHRRRTRGGS